MTVVVDNKKISILLFGSLLIGLVLGLFVDRMISSREYTNVGLSFSTQSVQTDVVDDTSRILLGCPWSDELFNYEKVILSNPLLDKTNDIISVQEGLIAKNYQMWGPVGSQPSEWMVSLVPQRIDDIEAYVDGGQMNCLYKSEKKKLFVLRKRNDHYCVSWNTMKFVGFSCSP